MALAPALGAAAEDEEPDIDFFYPLVTRRPVIERELELRVQHEDGRDGRRTDVFAAIEIPLLPRLQLELTVPVVFLDPREGRSQGGVGDLELEAKMLLFKSVQYRTLLAAGVEGRLPTGSERRGLGGEASIEPFVSGGVALGEFDLLSGVAYEWNLNSHVRGQREQQLSADVAIGWRLARRFAPLLELNTVTRTRGDEDEHGRPVKGRIQVSLTPGFNVRAFPGTTLRLGVQLPVSPARTFDYRLHGGFVWEF